MLILVSDTDRQTPIDTDQARVIHTDDWGTSEQPFEDHWFG